MEYTLHVNQPRAIEWGLTGDQALLFSYLANPGDWLRPLPEDPSWRWIANAKLQREIPLVCTSRRTTFRALARFEELGLIERRVVGSRSYYRLTTKGWLWRSPTALEELADEQSEESETGAEMAPVATPERVQAVPKVAQGGAKSGTGGSAKSGTRSVIPDRSVTPRSERETRARESAKPFSASEQLEVIAAWNRICSPPLPQVTRWVGTQGQMDLARCASLDPSYRTLEFWEALFEAVADDDFLTRCDKNGSPLFSLRWLVREENFLSQLERLATPAPRAAGGER